MNAGVSVFSVRWGKQSNTISSCLVNRDCLPRAAGNFNPNSLILNGCYQEAYGSS